MKVIREILRERKRILKYYFKAANTDLSRQYWIARLDEVDRIRLELKRKGR